ncbi:MAG: InlB B-repeat-containing protein [Sandaracinus sp.]
MIAGCAGPTAGIDDTGASDAGASDAMLDGARDAASDAAAIDGGTDAAHDDAGSDANVDAAVVGTLSVTKTGAGSGSVASAPAGIDCGATCSAPFSVGAMVVLTATPAAGSTIAGWGGACSGTASTCTVSVAAVTDVTIDFGLVDETLEVTVEGTGAGVVTSAPAGIDCGAGHTTCTTTVPHGTSVTLTAAPSTGSTFAGWSGACTGTDPCVVTVDAATAVTATFTLESFPLTVVTAGSGAGIVSSSPAGIDCGTTCAASFDYGTMVTLTAAPGLGSSFDGWSGACTGTGTCTVSITAATTVTASFSLQTFALTVARAGTGVGTVTSSPAGITCGATCTASYAYGTMVTLTAAPALGSSFTGWSGPCSGTGTCTVPVTAAMTVTAGFSLQTFPLTVARTGTGAGVVTSSPAGITCGATCTASYAYGTMVTLTAAPALGSSFTGWSGPCSGTGTCIVSVTVAMTVTASFLMSATCDDFNRANGTVVSGWTERVGDWAIDAGHLRDTTTGSAYSHVATMDGSTQTNGCVRWTALHDGSHSVVASGGVLRWSAPDSYIVALVQDNGASGQFDSVWVYQYPAVMSIGSILSGSYGTSPNVEVCVNGTAVTVRVDAGRDGTYETSGSGTTTLTTAGLSGLMSYSTPPSPAADDFCWGP